MSTLVLILALSAGALTGLALGALGGGGSVLAVPALIYLLGFTPAAAATASLVVVTITSVTALAGHARGGTVDWRRGALFALAGLAPAALGGALSTRLPAAALTGAFAVLAGVAALGMLRASPYGGGGGARRGRGDGARRGGGAVRRGRGRGGGTVVRGLRRGNGTVVRGRRGGGTVRRGRGVGAGLVTGGGAGPVARACVRRVAGAEAGRVVEASTGRVPGAGVGRVPGADTGPVAGAKAGPVAGANAGCVAGAGVGLGAVTGVLGVGGGFLAVPALVKVVGLRMRVAVGTSLLVISINSVVALAGRAGASVPVDWAPVAPFAAAAVLGAWDGRRLAAKVSAGTLQRVFAWGLLGVAAFMLVEAVL
ncbi:TSUP family transporter [Streptomyces sp. NPDC056716]|uniref:TSUP family transporter n=1 Tax=unclassified Streptomyces TaxID=2593676 RepID=UPI0036828099